MVWFTNTQSTFKTPIFQNWSDTMPIDSVDKDITCVSDCTELNSGALSRETPLKANGECNFLHIPETITKDWITNHPKYRHLFQGIGCFNCKSVTIELQSDAEPTRKVPLALKNRFSAEIQSMVQQGTQSMETQEWLNSFIIVK